MNMRRLGLVAFIAGLALFAYLLYTYVFANLYAQRQQDHLVQTTVSSWGPSVEGRVLTRDQFEARAPMREEERAGISKDGQSGAYGVLRVPRWGGGYAAPIVTGVDEAALARGVGWEPSSPLPGERGNVILAAHRVTHGEPFRDFPQLQAGDEVVVETETALYTYRLLMGGNEWVVDETEAWRGAPIFKRQREDARLLTLITCTDLYHSPRRSLTVGVLTGVIEKTPGVSS